MPPGEMRYLGTKARPAVLFLIRRLDDESTEFEAAVSLARLGLDKEATVPALIGCIRRGSRDLTRVAI